MAGRRISPVMAAIMVLALTFGLAGAGPVAASEPEAISKCAQGEMLLERGDFPAAAGIFREAIKMAAGLADGYYGLGRALYGQGQYQAAEEALLTANRLEQNPFFLKALADVRWALGQVEAAVENYRQAVASDGPAAANAGLGNALLALGETTEAIPVLRAGIAKDPYEIGNFLVLGRLYRLAGDLTAAEQVYRDALRYGLNTSAVRKGLGVVYHAQEKFDPAATEFNLALRMNPVDAEAFAYLGDLYTTWGKAAMAEGYYHQAITLAGDQGDLLTRLGDALFVQGKLELAKEAYLKAMAGGAESALLQVSLGQVYAGLGQPAAAEEQFAAALQLAGENPVVNLAYGRFLLAEKRYEAAETVLAKVVKLQPGDGEALVALGDACYGRQHHWRAEEFYHQALALDARNQAALNGLGLVALEEGRDKAAEDYFFRLMQLESGEAVNGPVGLGYTCLQQQRLGDALKWFNQAVVRNQQDGRPHLGLGYLARAEGNDTEALAKFKYARRVDPGVVDILAKNHLPVAEFTVKPAGGPAPLKVAFNAGQAYDPDGQITGYQWRIFPVGAAPVFQTGSKEAAYEFTVPGAYQVELVVEDDQGAQRRAVREVPVSAGITLCYNGAAVPGDPALGEPRLEDDRVLVPMRQVFELLGAELAWDGATGTVTGRKPAHEVRLTVGSATAFVNGATFYLDVPARVDVATGRLLVPLRLVAEALGAQVSYDPATRTVSITD